ncbi:MAG: diguanylate cyclase [Myxococcota bacterium]
MSAQPVLEQAVTTGDLVSSLGTSVLLVEDDVRDAQVLEEFLQRQASGIEVTTVDTLHGALQHLSARSFSLVLFDLTLYDASGVTGVQEIHNRHPEVPIVVLASVADQRAALQAVKCGAQDFLVKGRIDGSGLVHAIRYAIERKKNEQRLAFLAHHDELTGLANRIKLKERLESALDRCRRSGERCAVLFLDLDRFKEINDTLGHEAGDLLLQQVAERLNTCVRSFETVARHGGDEFIILLEHIDSAEDAVVVARRVLGAMHQPFAIPRLERAVGTSVGIALSEQEDNIESLIEKADHAMYRAKRMGRGTYAVYVPDAVQTELAELGPDVGARLGSLGFQVVYQPWTSLDDQSVLGTDVKLRWHHPVHGLKEGDEVWPHLDEAGVAQPVLRWLVETTARRLRRWRTPPSFRAVVPILPKILLEEGVPAMLARVIREVGIEADQIELAITESLLLQRRDPTVARLVELRSLGIRIRIDDFGSRCGLDDLTRLPVDGVRLSRDLTSDIPTAVRRKALLRAVVELSRNLGIDSFVSDVETVEEENTLAEMGCTGASGTVVSPSMPAEAFAVWLSYVGS